MREIKFRIWDDQLEKMVLMPCINSFRSSHLPSEAGTPVDYEITSGIVEKTIQENSKYTNICNDMEIMQFTGLHDKNGKEIYEGDIVLIEIDLGEVDGIKKMIEEVNDIHAFNFLHKDDGELIEKIGNVYENPELLKETI